MKKAISAKKVLDVLIEQFNVYSRSCAYLRAQNDFEIAERCQEGITAVYEIFQDLGFSETEDYTSERITDIDTEDGTPIMYYRRIAL